MINKMEEKERFRIEVEYVTGKIGFYDYFYEENAIKTFEDFCPLIERRSSLMIMDDTGLYEIKRTVTA